MIRPGRGIRDHVDLSNLEEGMCLVYNDEACELEAIAVRFRYPSGNTATGTMMATAILPAAGDTVTIDTVTYKFVTAFSGAPNEVMIAAISEDTLVNLQKAMEASGTAGVEYSAGTVKHATVEPAAVFALTFMVQHKGGGEAGNSMVTSTTSAQLSWGGPTLSGGTDINLEFGYCVDGETEEESTTVGTINLTGSVLNTHHAELTIPDGKPRLVMPANSWLVVKSLGDGIPTGFDQGRMLFIRRRRLAGVA